MKRILTLTLPLILLAGCVARSPQPGVVEGSPASVAPVAATPLAELLPEGHHAGAMVEVNGAQIVAIVADNAPKETPYLVLDEAMKAGVCTIKETGSVDENGQQVNGDVNTLLVTNTGTKPVFLMAGDLMLGGKQDRVLAESVVVDPGTKDMGIPVFCVEHGRWTVQSKDGEEAAKGHFSNEAEVGQVEMNVKRVALASGDQSRVWSEVATFTTSLGVGNPTGTFRATYDDENTRKKIDDAYRQAARLLGDGVVGFAVVHDGEVAAMDIFDSAGLATKLSEKLLRSYIVTAVGNGYTVPVEQKTLRTIRSATCTVEFERASLTSVVSSLRESLGVDIELGDVDGATEVSLDVGRLRGDQALQLVMETIDCAAIVRGESVVITRANTLAAGTGNDAGFFFGDMELGGNVRLADGTNVRTQTRISAGGGQLQLAALPETTTTAPGNATPNNRTVNEREFSSDAMKYSCEDKRTGRKVQTSYMRR